MLRRRLVALLLLAGSASLGSVVLLPTSPAAARTVTVAAPSANRIPIGTEVVTLRGRLGRTIPRWARLERKTHGHWVLVRRARLARPGAYAFSVPMPAGAQSFRVVAPRTKGRHGRRWDKRITRVRTVHRAIQTANVAVPQAIRVGSPTTIGLAFAPARPGRGALLQVNQDGTGWRTLGSVAQSSTGRAAYPFTATTNGTFEFRAVALASAGAPQLVGPSGKAFALPTKRMKVAAHRGFSGFYPENTLPAYDGALNNGADWLETDFQRTKVADTNQTCVDGTQQKAGQLDWVALHDIDFTRTTNVERVFPRATNPTKYNSAGRPVVELFTLCEIKTLDAGKWKGDAYAGTRVPTLQQTLDRVSQSTRGKATRLLVEPKRDTTGEAVDLFKAIRDYDEAHADVPGYWPFIAAGHGDRALFDTFDLPTAQVLADPLKAPGAEVAVIADELAPDETDPARFPAGVALLLKDSFTTRARVAAIHAAGQDVIVWTVNSESRWLELASLGVDAVITDQPKRALAALPGTD